MELGTKFAMPRQLPGLVDRPRLWLALDDATRSPLTIVSGSAGTGKTTLVSSWIDNRRLGAVAWVSLDERDNDPAAFWRDVLAALHDANVEGTAFDATSEIEPLVLLTEALDAREDPITLVLDDLHEISDDAIRDDFVRLVRQAPRCLRVLALTRSDATVRSRRLLLEGLAVEISASDLAFGMDEAGELFALGGVEMAGEQLARLWERTEGWAAGLGLVALSLRAGVDVNAAVERFGGDAGAVSEYLFEEVLERLPPADRDLLLRASVVNEVCGELLDAITGQFGAAARLEELRRRGIPLQSLDDQRAWYRPHRLILEFLRGMLHRSSPPAEVAAMHGRAAMWLAAQGRELDGVRQAVASGDGVLTAELLTRHYMALLLRGQIPDLRSTLERVPPAWLSLSPVFGYALARGTLADQDVQDAERWMRAAERAPMPAEHVEREAIAIIRTVTLLFRARLLGDFDVAGALSEETLAALDATPDLGVSLVELRSFVQVNLGAAEVWRGDLIGGRRRLLEGLAHSGGQVHLRFVGLAHVATVLEWTGVLTDAERDAAEALLIADRHGWTQHVCAVVARAVIARVALGRMDLPMARQTLEDPSSVARLEHRQIRSALHVLRSELQLRDGHPEDALQTLAAAEADLELAPRSAVVMAAVRAQRALVLCETSGLDAGEKALVEHPDAPLLADSAVLALIRVRQDRAEEAADIIAPWITQGRDAADGVSWVRAHLAAALAAAAGGEKAQSSALLDRALALTAGEGLRSPFRDMPQELMEPLLRAHRQRAGAHSAFAMSLLGDDEDVAAPPRPLPVADALSERELATLRFLPTDLSNAEIASELFVSVNTVKSHVRSIYRKLDVNDRRQAVRRGRQLGLLSPR